MSSYINYILILGCAVGGYIILKKLRSGEPKIVRTHVVDPASQELYDKKRHKEDDDKKLTLQEKIELSWAFLVNITEQVMNQFSQEDQQKVENAGHTLAMHGAKYQHNVDGEAKVVRHVVRAREQEQNKDQSLAR